MERRRRLLLLVLQILLSLLSGMEASAAGRLDLASVAMAHGWSAHATVGEASFDDFTHAAANPVYTGSGDEQWPVNGFLYGGAAGERNINQTLYIGLYGRNYAKPWSMLGASSTDGGRSFQLSTGPLVCDSRSLLFNLTHGCPDGSAVDDGHGGVHMVFDWTDALGAACADDGLGYQHCATPLGPCKISPVPVNRMVNNTEIFPGYVSTYGGTLIKRASGWLVLSAISTHGNGGGIWGLAAMTSNSSDPDPAVSPYSAPKLVLFPESDRWHPHPCEFYPCFSSGSHVYCPCTSLQANRGFQVLYRARLEAAHKAEGWEVYQAGSLYHWEGGAGEDCAESGGIWGQTFTGFVDVSGGFQMMYPSRARMKPGAETCDGTINLARAPNFAALRSHGFWVSGPSADSMTAFSQTLAGFDMNVTARLAPVGGGWTLRWNWRGEIGPAGAPVAGAHMDPRALYSNTALCFDGKGLFSVIQVNGAGSVTYLHKPSPTPGAGGGPIRIELSQSATSCEVAIKLNGTSVVSGLQLKAADVGGSVAVHVTHGASVHVTEMVVAPTAEVAQRWLWLTASDGITGGGDAALGGWKAKRGPTFRTGQGFTSAGGNRTMAKWSFIGAAARLYLPRGPEFGSIAVSVDGGKTSEIDLHAAAPAASSAVFEWHAAQGDTGRAGLAHGHALVVRWISGGMAADGVEFLPPPIGTAQTRLKTTDGPQK